MPTPNNIPTFITDAGSMRRDASVVSRDAAARTVNLAFSSEVEVDRGDWIEVLSHDPEAVDLSRLNDGGAVLAHHDWNDQRGVVESAWIDSADRKGRAVVKFSRSRAGEELLADVEEGIRRHVSVGYRIQDAKVVGARADGTSIVLVTRWQPYEISFVPVPADTTVGVGRSAAPHPERNTNRMSTRSIRNTRARDTGVICDLRELIRDAMNAQPFRARIPVGASEPTGYLPTPTKRSLILPLQSTSLVGLVDGDGNVTRTPAGSLAGDTITMHGATIAASRVAQAGASIIVRTEGSNAFALTGGTAATVALERKPVRLVSVDPAPFGTVEEDADAPSTALSNFVHSFDLVKNWGDSQTAAFSVELKRSDFQMIDSDEIMAEVLQSITLGLSRAADACLLSAIAAATPDAFSLAAVASRGLRFGDVRALAGTSATGAAVDAYGALRVAGVPAELTAGTPDTLVGAWDRAGVAINDEVVVLAERVNQAGKLSLSVFAQMLPVVLDASVFWSVSAQ